MGRLFITPREIDFISDITKEIIKDVIGQTIFYFSVSETKSLVHDLYLEAPEKIFENPLELDALVEWEPSKVKTDMFGSERLADIKAWVHARDLIDKGVNLSVGDFFSFGEKFYEVISLVEDQVIYGEVEHRTGFSIMGKQARQTQFVTRVFGPTDEALADADAVQGTFVQQRGVPVNREGPTGDVRDLEKKGVVDPGLTGPKEVSPRGSDSGAGSAFYGDD